MCSLSSRQDPGHPPSESADRDPQSTGEETKDQSKWQRQDLNPRFPQFRACVLSDLPQFEFSNEKYDRRGNCSTKRSHLLYLAVCEDQTRGTEHDEAHFIDEETEA